MVHITGIATTLLSLCALGLAADPTPAKPPKAPTPPPLTWLTTFTNYFSATPPIAISPYLNAILITNGTFAGPKLNGRTMPPNECRISDLT